MSELCSVCHVPFIASEDGEHLCGLTRAEAYSLGWRRGNNVATVPAVPTASTTERRWHKPEDKLPPDNALVHAMLSDGQVTTLKRIGHFWFVPDGSMYVYYVPTFWKLVIG